MGMRLSSRLTIWRRRRRPKGGRVGFLTILIYRLVADDAAGIRNYAARNNLRDMRKGDKAFFYHSNCKEPGIVGIISIVKEHSPDCK